MQSKLENNIINKDKNYYKMIKYFLSENFKFTKENLTLFFNEFHKKYYNFIFDKNLSVNFFEPNEQTYKNLVNFGAAQFVHDNKYPKNQNINILLDNLNGDLFQKWVLLSVFFHEVRHEQQFDNICIKLNKNISDYEHLIKFSYLFGQELHCTEIIEIEAAAFEIENILDILINNKSLINKQSVYFLIDAIKGFENDLSFLTSEDIFKEFRTKYWPELKKRGIKALDFPLTAKQIIEVHSIAYNNHFSFWRNHNFITIENENYKNKIAKILQNKIDDVFIPAVDFVHLVSYKFFNPNLKINKNDNLCLSKDDFKKFQNTKKRDDIIEILYFGLADKFENDDENKENKNNIGNNTHIETL